MIHYHGTPITPDTAAAHALAGGHAFIAYTEEREPRQLAIAAQWCQSFAVDNGAFTAWKQGKPRTDWSGFYEWAATCRRLPSCDFAVVPDVIDGSEADNDALAREWPLPRWFGAPVWHMHESLERLERLASDWPRICIGSSGDFATVATAAWWQRIGEAMRIVCDDEGRPLVRIHGLRMLNPDVVARVPLTSADSTNLGRNIGIDSRWNGPYSPPSKESRAAVLRARIESTNAPTCWAFAPSDAAAADSQGALW